MDLNELADRVEALSGPDRRVDCAIFATVYPDKFGDSAAMYARIDWTRNRADWMWLRDLGMPAYTASIDAAITLVPDGWNWGVWRRHDWAKQNAQVWHPQQESWTKHGDAATPALAIVAAALRARSQATPQ